MLRTIQKLVSKEKKAAGYDETLGYLTKEDIKVLRQASVKPRSPLKKNSYTTWNCTQCKHSCYYAILRCPLCESKSIEVQAHPIFGEVLTSP